MFKNINLKINLGQKLIGAFCAVTIIIAIVGLMGYRAADKSMEHLDEIGGVRLKSSQHLLTISEAQSVIDGAENGLISAKITQKERNELYNKITNAWERANASVAVYASLAHTAEEDALWEEFIPAWDEWKKDNEEFIILSKELDNTRILDPMGLKYNLANVEVYYLRWMLGLSEAAAEATEFHGELDPAECVPGKWLAAFKTDNAELQEAALLFKERHDKLHVAAGKIIAAFGKFNKKNSKGKRAKAMMKVYDEEVLPTLEPIKNDFMNLTNIVNKSVLIHDQINHKALIVNAKSFNKAGTLLKNIVDINLKLAGHAVADSNSAASSAKIILIVTILFGILLAVFLGISFSKSIVNIINELLAETKLLTDAIEEGKLDVRGDVEKVNFEVRDIVQGMNNTVDAFLAPISLVSDYINRMGEGDIPSGITREFKGDFEYIKMSLSNCIKTVNGLLEETRGLINAGREGNLQARGKDKAFKGSWGEVIHGINSVLDAVLEPIVEAKAVLEDMAKGDLTKEITGDYKGDYAIIKNSINETLNSLNDILSQVTMASEQIASGSQQVSDSSQSLSQGATEQASSLEQITSAMAEIGLQTTQNAENAAQANKLASQTRDSAGTGNEQMKSMILAMEEINASSKSISKIIKVIDEIAFQTNLLALNAAVEAARAGKHGKGFAVVAEEVRNLAARSAKAAKETADMIESSLKKAEAGAEIAIKTGSALEEIVTSVTKVTDLVGEIAAASNEQAHGFTQINQGLGQIEQVTQQNTANAEESASAAIELSSQARQLQGMIKSFKLRAQIGMVEPAQPQLEAAFKDETVAAIPHDAPSEGSEAEVVKPSDVIELDDKEFGKY
jgi:methyl-accepting chemotaxis protein